MFSKRNLKVMVCMISALSVITVSGCSSKAPETKATTAPASSAPAASAAPKAFAPDKPVSLIVIASPGGSTDMLARAVEKTWPKYCPQPVLIVNKPGGGGVEGAALVARSKPDGQTMVIGYGSGHDLVMPHIQKVEYDPFKDLVPISRLSVHSVMVAAPANSEFKSVKDVVEWGKKENKPVTAAVSTTAGAVDIVMRGIGKVSGIQVTPVPHQGGSQAITTLVGGQTMIGGGHPAEILAQLKGNKIKPLAIATPERDPLFKDVPTLKEQGIDLSTWGSVKGIAAPVGTTPEMIKYYEDLFKKICDDEEFKKTMTDMGQPIMYQNAADFTKFFKQAFDDYGKLVKDLGLDKK